MEKVITKYPIGIQGFEKLRTNGYIYVDKTEYIYDLVNNGAYYFLSRPRRFGKSLLLSTMKAYFEGKRDLFKGLAIEKLEQDWTEYPVLYLDLNTGRYEEEGTLTMILDETLSMWEKLYDIETSSPLLEVRFKHIIKRAHEKMGKPVVILVDEYDKPLLQTIGKSDLQDSYRSTLKAFYSNLKSMDEYIQFAFMTGVTKFSKVSIFSDLNNLNDISMNETYAGICGITETELHDYFQPSIAEMANAEGVNYEEMALQLKKMYDGYRFTQKKKEGIYNPFSLMNAFFNMNLGSYWFATGTPTFLVELFKNCNYELADLQEVRVSGSTLNRTDSAEGNPIPVLYQSGYLTIKDYDSRFDTYLLRFPNKEVEIGFTKFLLPYYTPKRNKENVEFIDNFVLDLESGNPNQFMQRLQTFFSASDYRIAGEMELYFHNAMYLIFRLMGFFTQVERATSQGRVDVVVETADYVYVIEIKLDGTPKEALQQIEEKGYAKPYAMDKRKLYKIGVNFSSNERGVESWEIV